MVEVRFAAVFLLAADLTVFIAPGTYRLTAPLIFDARDSGTTHTTFSTFVMTAFGPAGESPPSVRSNFFLTAEAQRAQRNPN